jgi:diamine N-acetyltransferase
MMRIEPCKDSKLLARLNRDVQDLHVEMYPELFKPYDAAAVEGFFSRTLRQDNWTSFVAYEEQEPVGFIQVEKRVIKDHPFRKDTELIYVHQICVRNDWNGKGVGSALMERARQHARQLGITRMELDVWSGNVHASGFFEKLGYRALKEQMEFRV